MDPATVFLLYVLGGLCLWMLAANVRPGIEVVSNLSLALPVGRRVAAMVISAVLVGNVGAARADVGPPASRMVQMADRAASISVGTVSAPQRPMISAVGSTYTVVSGDSLWKIARSILSEDGASHDGSETSTLWRSIYHANRELIGANPNLIHPGQVLQIPGR